MRRDLSLYCATAVFPDGSLRQLALGELDGGTHGAASATTGDWAGKSDRVGDFIWVFVCCK